MPISWFEEKQIQSEAVENGWIVSGKNLHPWYLDNYFSSPKIPSEASYFIEKQKAIEYSSSKRELINAKWERDLKVVCSIMNAGHEHEAEDLDYTIREHKVRRDLITAPSNTELGFVRAFSNDYRYIVHIVSMS